MKEPHDYGPRPASYEPYRDPVVGTVPPDGIIYRDTSLTAHMEREIASIEGGLRKNDWDVLRLPALKDMLARQMAMPVRGDHGGTEPSTAVQPERTGGPPGGVGVPVSE